MKCKKIYLTEEQFNALMEQQILNESFKSMLQKVALGAISVSMALSMISGLEKISDAQKEQKESEVVNAAPEEEWKMIADDVVVTVYNAVPAQCNADVRHTASMFKLDLKNPEAHKIIAMERTMMSEFGLKYGDIVKIEGTYNGIQDGVYQIQDTMNKRFAGQHKVDILVSNNVKYGGTLKNSPAKVYVLNDKSNESTYKMDMAPQYNATKNI